MYDPDVHSVRSGNYHTLTLTTPVAQGGGTSDYERLHNKPSINGHELVGNSSLEDIGIPDLSNVPKEVLTIEDLDDIISEDFPDAPSEPLTPEDLDDITKDEE